jgi:hypothetical protein
MGLGGSSSPRLEFARFPEWADSTDNNLPIANPETQRNPWDDIRLDAAPEFPLDTVEVLFWENSLLSITADGAYLFDPESTSVNEPQKISVLGFDVKLPKSKESHSKITDADWDFRKPLAACPVANSKQLVVVSKGAIALFEFDGKKLTKTQSLDLNFPAETVANVTVCGRTAIVCPEDSIPILVNLDAMTNSYPLESLGKVTIKRTTQAPDGRVALLNKDGRIWVLKPSTSDNNTSNQPPSFNLSVPNLTGQAFASTISFDTKNRLWVAHHTKQVDAWNADLTKSELTFRPVSTTPEFLYDYFINPFYLVNPKPSAIQETIQFVLRNPDNKVTAIDRGDLDMPNIQRDPWQPIWTNAIFIAVMLSASCWLLYRQDL